MYYDNKPFDTFDEVKSRPVAGSVSETINVPISCVWGIISNYGCEKAYFPDMLYRVGLTGHGVGAIRRIEFAPFEGLAGFTVDERLEAIEPNNFRILYSKEDVPDDPYPAKGVTGMIELKALSDNSTQICWTSHAKHPSPDPKQREFLKTETERRYRHMVTVFKKLLEGRS